MNANHTSAHKTRFGHTNRLSKATIPEGALWTVRKACWVIPVVLIWCRDHVLSITVLLMFPVAIAGYYWSNASSEPSQPPPYFMLEEENESASRNESQSKEQAPVVSVTPETSTSLDAPPALSFSMDSQVAELTAPQPLPDSSQGIGSFPQTEHTAGPQGNAPVLFNPQPTTSSVECVWLTGSIEVPETSTEMWQNASRVHELMGPNHN